MAVSGKIRIRKTGTRSLRTKILTIVLAFFALVSLAFVVYSLFTTANYKRLRLEGIKKTVEFETEKVNKTIAEIERGAVLFVIGGELCYEAQSKAQGETLALEFFRSYPTSIGGGFWYAPYASSKGTYREGFYAFYDAALGEVRLDDTFFTDEYDYHNSSWYTEISQNATEPYQVIWTKPYYDDSGSFALMTTAGAGFFDESGNLIAISTVDWEIDEVIKDLTAIQPTENSFAVLCVPEQGYSITNTMTKKSGTDLSELPWDIGADAFSLDGAEYMVFRRMMDNGWLLLVQVPTNEIFAEVEGQNNRFSLIIAASAVFLLCVAFLLISRLITKPLKRLTDDVARLGIGNLEARIDVTSNDELGLLADTFNKMTSDLKESIDQNARVTAEKERIGAELNVATQIQASMLPCIFPAFPNHSEFDIYAMMLPAKEVGGDFYDFFLVDEYRLAMVIADVSGKGVPAALFMVIAKTLIKNNAQYGKSPKEIFETVNDMLCESNEAGMFVTAFMGIWDMRTGLFSYVNAGHNRPLLKRANRGFEWLPTRPGFVLAGMEGIPYKQEEITLHPGDAIFMYTDGVTEATNPKDELFSDARLLKTVNDHQLTELSEFVARIKTDIDRFADSAEQADDITMLVMKIAEE